MGRYRITDLDRADRPRERLASVGAGALSNAELIAILLGSGIQGQNAVQLGQALLIDVGGVANLPKVAYKQLVARRGIGRAKAAQLIAAIELGRRISISSPDDRPRIQSPEDAAISYSNKLTASSGD